MEQTKLQLSHGGSVMTWEGPWDSDLDEILNGLIGCLIGVGFSPNGIHSYIKDWAEEFNPEDPPEEEDNDSRMDDILRDGSLNRIDSSMYKEVDKGTSISVSGAQDSGGGVNSPSYTFKKHKGVYTTDDC